MRILIVVLSVVLFVSCNQKKNSQDNAKENITGAEYKEEVLHIGKMHCEMCVMSVEKGLESVEGVEFVKVNLEDSTAFLRYNASETDREDFRIAIEKRGYVLKDNQLYP